MTLAEIIRKIESNRRVEKAKAQERAAMDYIQADLIGKSIARIYSSSNHMPQLYEAYPNLFDSEDIAKQQQEKRDKLTALRFKQFASNHNSKFKGGSKANE